MFKNNLKLNLSKGYVDVEVSLGFRIKRSMRCYW